MTGLSCKSDGHLFSAHAASGQEHLRDMQVWHDYQDVWPPCLLNRQIEPLFTFSPSQLCNDGTADKNGTRFSTYSAQHAVLTQAQHECLCQHTMRTTMQNLMQPTSKDKSCGTHLNLAEVLAADRRRGHLLTAADAHVLIACHASADTGLLLHSPGELLRRGRAVVVAGGGI